MTIFLATAIGLPDGCFALTQDWMPKLLRHTKDWKQDRDRGRVLKTKTDKAD